MKNLTALIASIFSLLIISCGDDDNYREYIRSECNNIDSIFQFYDSHKNEENVYLLSSTYNRFKTGGFIELAELFLKKRLERIDSGIDTREAVILSAKLDLAFDWVFSNEATKGDSILNILSKKEGFSPDFDKLYYQIRGSKLFMDGQYDSAVKYFESGLKIANELKDTSSIIIFNVNLGAASNAMGLQGAAQNYFINAYELDKSNLMLINNIASILIQQQRYAEAETYLNKKIDQILDFKNKSYNNIMMRLTYTGLKQNQGDWKTSNMVLKSLKESDIPQSHDLVFNYFWLKDSISIIEDEQTQISYLNSLSNQEFSDLFLELLDDFNSGNLTELWEYYSKNINRILNQEYGKKYEAGLISLKANNARRLGDYKRAYKLEEKAKQLIHQSMKAENARQYVDIQKEIDLIQLRQSNELINKQLMYVRDISHLKNTAIAISVFFIIGLSIIIIQYRKVSKNNFKLKDELLSQKEAEKNAIERENEANKRVIAISDLIIQRARDLKKEVLIIPVSNRDMLKPTLEIIDHILLVNSTVNTTKTIRKVDFSSFPFLSENLTDSQLKILALTLEEYKPKEISSALDLSYAYVRNVQSKIRKILRDEGFKEFQDFQSHLNQKFL
ncbi:MAG: tetratricopeptide repeat protein [Bacteroidia bacterium]